MQPILLLQGHICAFFVVMYVWYIAILAIPPIPSSYTHIKRTIVVIAENSYWRARTPPPTHGAAFDRKYAIACLRVLHV